MNTQTIAFEYDLPFSTQVTLTLVLQDQTELPLCTQAAPGAVVDMRQRITLAPGSYLLSVRLDMQGRDAASVLAIRTRPAAPGPQPWTLVANIEAAESGPQDHQYWVQLDGPATISLLAAFGPEDAQSAVILRSVELFR